MKRRLNSHTLKAFLLIKREKSLYRRLVSTKKPTKMALTKTPKGKMIFEAKKSSNSKKLLPPKFKPCAKFAFKDKRHKTPKNSTKTPMKQRAFSREKPCRVVR